MTPLWALLSHAYVAYTIEFDNEAEHRLQHRATRHGRSNDGVWLVSMAMWFNCMRFIPDGGITAKELLRSALTATNLKGMARWGYVTVKDHTVSPTAKGQAAQRIWAPLFETIEERWRERFGDEAMERLRISLIELAGSFGRALPDVMPILGYGLRVQGRVLTGEHPVPEANELAKLPLPPLLAKPLIAMAILFERRAEVSLAISANVLRLIESPMPVRDLPARSGVSKESIEMALTFLLGRGYATLATKNRTRILTLTPNGRAARNRYFELVEDVEHNLAERFGHETVANLRSAIETIIETETAPARLLAGLEPYPGNWRASVPRPDRLPDFPMVLHRGGYPDGS